MVDVSDPGQGEREDRSQAGQAHAEGRHKGLAKASADPWPTGFLISPTEGCSFCGRLFLARVPQVFPAAQAEPGFLEGED